MESYDFNSGSNDHHSRDLKEERTWKKKIFMKANICRRCIRLVNLPDCLELYGLLPKPAALATAFISAASAFGFLWIVEPISYFTVLGPVGTYMAFLSGNISNMRVPCAGMAQVAADVDPGTEKGSIVSVIGMATSIVINVSVLTIGVILGISVLSAMPASVIEALNYLLPALFGALLMQFGLKRIKFAGGMLAFAILIGIAINAGLFNWLPGAANYLTTLASVFVAIGVTLATYGKKKEAGK